MFQSYKVAFASAALALCFTSAQAEFNMTTCPAYYEIQQPSVESFDVERYTGFYYE